MADTKRLWYMRDNHLFRELPLDVKQACEAVREEFAAGFTYGILCATGSAADDCRLEHAGGELAEFLPRAREWLVYQIGYCPPGELEYQSWLTALAAPPAAASGQAAVQEVQPVAAYEVIQREHGGSVVREIPLTDPMRKAMTLTRTASVPGASTSQPSAQTDDALRQADAALRESDALLRIALAAMFKMGLRDRGSDIGLSHEVRMFALAFSQEGRDGPGALQIRGDGRLWKLLRDLKDANAAITQVLPQQEKERG